jgi:hypothetical protein
MQKQTSSEKVFEALIQMVLEHPLYAYDMKLRPDEAFRVAAGDCIVGLKRPNPGDTIIPPPILSVYQASPHLSARYPRPENIFEPDHLMFWARGPGRELHPEIAAYFADAPRFVKYIDPDRPFDRSLIRNLPPIPLPGTRWFTDSRLSKNRISKWRGFFFLLPHWINQTWLHVRRGEWDVLRAKVLDAWRKGLVPLTRPQEL